MVEGIDTSWPVSSIHFDSDFATREKGKKELAVGGCLLVGVQFN